MVDKKLVVASGLVMALGLLPGCSRMQRTVGQVAGPIAPHDLKMGQTPRGGPSESPTGAGAGGSAAMGYETGRVAGDAAPVTGVKPPGFMAPVGSDGGGLGDSGHPIPPTQPIVPANSRGVTQPISANPSQLPVNVRG